MEKEPILKDSNDDTHAITRPANLRNQRSNSDEHPPVVVLHPGERPQSTKAARKWVLARAIIGEFIVTTVFLYCVMAATYNAHLNEKSDMAVAPLITGFSAVALIYSFADVSGAHFNPSVTIATMVTRETTLFKGSLYLVAQILGSILATFLVGFSFKDPTFQIANFLRTTVADRAYGSSFSVEAASTYVLVLVIFSVVFDTLDTKNVDVLEDAHRDGLVHKVQAHNLTIYTTSGNSKAGFAPIAIGLTLGALTLMGGVFNPARATGPALVAWDLRDLWVYWLGGTIGGVVGGLTQMGLSLMKHQAMLEDSLPLYQ